jgi:hypothetical protein
MKQLTIAICICTLSAAAQVTAPRIGMATDNAGRLRPITGVAGNLIPGAPVASGVLSAAASDVVALVKTRAEIVVIEQGVVLRARAPEGPALFAFAADGTPAFAWLPTDRALLRWTGNNFAPVPLETAAISGDIVAIGVGDTAHINLAVSQNGALQILRVSLIDGVIAVVTSLPDQAHAPLLMADGAILYAVPGALVLRDSGGHERQIPFSGAASAITPMSSRWAQVIATSGRRYAVRLADGAAFQIPGVR